MLRYTQEWERYVTRQARWVDFEHDYKTLDLSYMESVMWAFKTLWDKGLIYEGYRVLPYCWRCETPLSNTELRMDDAYLDRQDPAVTVAFELEPVGDEPPTRILVWTTTPWTLPSNLALAVGEDIEYTVFEEGGVRYVLAEARVAAYEAQLAQAEPVGNVARRRARRSPLHAAVPVLRRHAERLRRARRRLRQHRGRHRRRPPRARLRRGRPEGVRGRTASR